jgi:hypothetical protein
MTHQFTGWIAKGNDWLSNGILHFIWAAFAAELDFDGISAEEDSLAAIAAILKESSDEGMQKDAVYALYNLSEHDHEISRRLADPEWIEVLSMLYDSPSFYLKRAVVQLFLSMEAHCVSLGTELTKGSMSAIVEIIEGYRGEMLESVLERLFCIFARARATGDGTVLDEFVAAGGIDALYIVMDDDLAREPARQRATDLFDRYFNSALDDGEGAD